MKALTQVPTVLQQMGGQLEWTQKLGDAFLAQQKDVMDSVQRLRQRAQGAGQLMTTAQQRVVTEGESIVIEQPNPEILYVPYYDPYTVYGGWPYPAYPPYYWSGYWPDYWPGYWPGYGLGSGSRWGLGIGITAAVWDCAFDWDHGDINVNVDRDNFTISPNEIDNVERDARETGSTM